MQHFWMGTWDASPPLPPTGRVSEPLAAGGAKLLALEILQDGDKYVVLVSAADSLEDPRTLQCLVGFANDPADCSAWRSRGFPLVDARIRCQGGLLQVFSSVFTNQPPMQYGELMLTVRTRKSSRSPFLAVN